MGSFQEARLERLHRAFLDGTEEFPDLMYASVTAWENYAHWPLIPHKESSAMTLGIDPDIWREVLFKRRGQLFAPLATDWLWLNGRLWQGAFYTDQPTNNPSHDDPDSLRRQHEHLQAGIRRFREIAREAAGHFSLPDLRLDADADHLVSRDRASRWLEATCRQFFVEPDRSYSVNAQKLPASIFAASAIATERLFEQAAPVQAHRAAAPDKIVVLFLAFCPTDQDRLCLDEEAREISEGIRLAEHRDALRLEHCWAARPRDALRAINEHKPAILHLCGHGDADSIAFQGDNGESKRVSRNAMAQVLKAFAGTVRLVFFNTCYSRRHAETALEHVEAAIGMNCGISDSAAKIFAAQFYSALCFGTSVKDAFEQAKTLLMMDGINEAHMPELFVARGDGSQLILIR